MFKLKTYILLIATLSLIPVYAAEKPKSTKKQTTAENYLTAKEAYDLKQQMGKKVLFVDIRTPSELVFVGVPENMDINIPISTIDYKQWDKKLSSFKKLSNKEFIADFNATIQSRNLTKNNTIILICRSGKRSAKTADLLTSTGYTNIHTVVDGFEGDKARKGEHKGKRVVNGWKNAGLPWTYKLNRNRLSLKK